MNATHILESHEANEQHHATNRSYWEVTYNILVIMSIVFSMATYLILDKDRFEKNPLLRFAIILLPLSCSAIQYLFLLYTNWKSNYEPEGTLHKALYYFFNVLLIAFAIISILSIIVLPINGWKGDDLLSSIVLPSFFIPPTYLLSTSCCLVPGQIGFTDTGINVLIDILILLCPLVSLVLIPEEPKYRLIPAILFPVLILIRLLREKYYPSGKSALPTAPWRVAVFVLILIIAVFAYALMVWGSMVILNNHFGLLDIS
ncbi:hypothetical protein [Encephalitozoon cuniculi GB-M1]|uniref:UPF0328 protein ECU07_0060 n=1 Tax=Encephalitozoon cuniculi (strain GB-M1) TaxID=284813 RepID=Y706_ENCCU|nr:uncharacterized protein ECU07_0060 [Encephalitozoon cuniculi GB-M1]Q8SV55.1 RecName: Full=UPF0328 protein ECU07_0060 [Encephalitozoon cuniculi GB-M1]UYI27162.1 DUF2463 domain-containing protein [Encephalitozoon cuniculi]CAD25538.1 hypothetical protein [Encephalitozoon cuniculi GB-M1]